MAGKVFFTLQYWLKNPPWDTGITPPEVYDFLEHNPPGRALDLGCGTGTNVITIADYGWQVTGIDYVPRAIKKANRKIRQAGLIDNVDLFVGDVLKPNTFGGEYQLILDVGCFHSFSGKEIEQYKENVCKHLVPGGNLLLYVHLNDDPGSDHGAKESDLALLGSNLSLISRQNGEESSRPSAWLKYLKK
jgi:cyclopropane fatty-acyl-phospholipid synthase-like methyltransferase